MRFADDSLYTRPLSEPWPFFRAVWGTRKTWRHHLIWFIPGKGFGREQEARARSVNTHRPEQTKLYDTVHSCMVNHFGKMGTGVMAGRLPFWMNLRESIISFRDSIVWLYSVPWEVASLGPRDKKVMCPSANGGGDALFRRLSFYFPFQPPPPSPHTLTLSRTVALSTYWFCEASFTFGNARQLCDLGFKGRCHYIQAFWWKRW